MAFWGRWNLLTSLDRTNFLYFPNIPPLFGVNRLFRTSLRGFFKSTNLVFKSFSPKKTLNRCFSHHPFPSSAAEPVWDPPYPIHGRGGGGENGWCRGEEGRRRTTNSRPLPGNRRAEPLKRNKVLRFPKTMAIPSLPPSFCPLPPPDPRNPPEHSVLLLSTYPSFP